MASLLLFLMSPNASGDVITVMLDFTAGTISFAKNGVCPGYGFNFHLVVIYEISQFVVLSIVVCMSVWRSKI
jgi:hypothetical protein